MILNTTLLNLQAVLAANITTSQPEAIVDYDIWSNEGKTGKPNTQPTALQSQTDVNILNAPILAGFVHDPIRISIYNKDTVSATVTIKTDDGTTERIIVKQLLASGETLAWERGSGWQIV